MLLTDDIQAIKQQLSKHSVYQNINSLEQLRHFMQGHVFCTWDFMSLLKSLQLHLTGMSLPWLPPKNLELARLINEIVLDEETDLINGSPISHFELYRQAMREIGCQTQTINTFVQALQQKQSLAEALQQMDLPKPVRQFIQTTFDILEEPVEVQAAVFFHSREDIIPPMFMEMVKNLETEGIRCPSFILYLDRHISVDSEKHGPLAEKLLASLLDNNPGLLPDARQSVKKALLARLTLWNYLATPQVSEVAYC